MDYTTVVNGKFNNLLTDKHIIITVIINPRYYIEEICCDASYDATSMQYC